MQNGEIFIFAEIHSRACAALPFILTTLGESLNQSDVFRPEGLDTHEFIWVKNGSGAFEVDGNSFILEKDEGVFIRSGTAISYTGEAFDTGWCTFLIASETLDYIGVPQNYFKFDVPKYLNNETDQLIKLFNSQSTILKRSAAGYSYIIDLFTVILDAQSSPISRILEYLENHYNKPVGLDEIAKHVNMNRFSLCRYFLKERGITVMDELKQIRISKAKRFLKYSSESIENISYLCGFESTSYFCKRFREAVGCSPLTYRKRHNE